MKIGMFTANFLDRDLESVFKMMAEHGYEAAELPAFQGNSHLDIEEVLKPGGAKRVRDLAKKYDITLSALSNHPEGQLVLGPHTVDTDSLYKGTPAEKIKFGMARMKRTAQAAAALEVPVVCGFIGCEVFARWFPWPYPQGWDKMGEDFVNRWGEILDEFEKQGVKFAHEPHPNEYVYNVETALKSVELMKGRKSWGFNFDPANIILQGIDPVIFVQELGDRIFHAHGKDGEIVEHNVPPLRPAGPGPLEPHRPRLPLPHPRLGLRALEAGAHRVHAGRLRLRHLLRARGRGDEPRGRGGEDHRLPEAADHQGQVHRPRRQAVRMTAWRKE